MRYCFLDKQSEHDRRHPVRSSTAGRAGVSWLLMLGILTAAGRTVCGQPPNPAAVRYERRERHMGTEFIVQAYAADADQADRAMSAALAEIGALDERLSNYRSDSELSRLSASAPSDDWVVVSPPLWAVLRQADGVSRLSGGAFDVTVGPCAKLWRRARRTGRMPDAARLRAARDAVGFEAIEYDALRRAVRLTRPGMLLDLGGIAKGYALDRAFQRLRQHGVTRALIDGGGDVLVGDPPPGQRGWRIGLAGLRADAPVNQHVTLANRAIATSGDLWQFVVIDDVRYSHLIDPRTGVGLTESSSVTVIAPTATQADAWASAVSVLGPADGLAALSEQSGLSGRVIYRIDSQPRVQTSPDFPRVTN